MQQQIVLNSEKLHTVSHASHTAEVTITALAMRERLRRYSDIPRMRNALIRKGEKIVDADYLSFWEGLQAAGVGRLVMGRLKSKSPERFEWYYSMTKVAAAAMEGKDVVASRVSLPVAVPKAKVQKKVVRLAKAKPAAEALKPEASVSRAEKFIYILLRKDFSLGFNVPANLSKEEIQTISKALSQISA